MDKDAFTVFVLLLLSLVLGYSADRINTLERRDAEHMHELVQIRTSMRELAQDTKEVYRNSEELEKKYQKAEDENAALTRRIDSWSNTWDTLFEGAQKNYEKRERSK